MGKGDPGKYIVCICVRKAFQCGLTLAPQSVFPIQQPKWQNNRNISVDIIFFLMGGGAQSAQKYARSVFFFWVKDCLFCHDRLHYTFFVLISHIWEQLDPNIFFFPGHFFPDRSALPTFPLRRKHGTATRKKNKLENKVQHFQNLQSAFFLGGRFKGKT